MWRGWWSIRPGLAGTVLTRRWSSVALDWIPLPPPKVWAMFYDDWVRHGKTHGRCSRKRRFFVAHIRRGARYYPRPALGGCKRFLNAGQPIRSAASRISDPHRLRFSKGEVCLSLPMTFDGKWTHVLVESRTWKKARVNPRGPSFQRDLGPSRSIFWTSCSD